ncbi:hypothetical protein VOLCADRAFT_96212 [Volvox carteri f. nagariensis]|uniref:Uncharacterized protein n=1 Tax=Volvox carteri f. nagariensis TaxID=3068 RepID=D8U9I5_VOLCA|nr:uncharacterized protein VOLCADRAFT_96212 [Volvox carteri f. nagariensis]EFJ43590.1 hypothetical protein VOLCADRAFT_96212 [Volvox carteri f. nagariensis]|eukprot:XP_002955290.1 hypothetical protein VOLCADRAFT_96212 [Volvox carteri f. nagariensis]
MPKEAFPVWQTLLAEACQGKLILALLEEAPPNVKGTVKILKPLVRSAKGSWDVFALLVAAAVLQLGGQLTRWLGSGSGRSSGNRRSKSSHGSAGAAAARRTGGGSVVVSDVAASPTVLLPDPRLGGVWVKDPERSDSMDEATAVMRLNGLVRTAIRLIRGLEIDPEALKAGRFDMAIFSVISFFKVRESYRLDGTVAHFNRRDLRRGKHTASIAVQPDGSVVLSISWAAAGSEPVAAAGGLMGYGSTTTQQPEAAPNGGDLLVVTSKLRVAGAARQIVYRTTYVRAGRGSKQHHDHRHN